MHRPAITSWTSGSMTLQWLQQQCKQQLTQSYSKCRHSVNCPLHLQQQDSSKTGSMCLEGPALVTTPHKQLLISLAPCIVGTDECLGGVSNNRAPLSIVCCQRPCAAVRSEPHTATGRGLIRLEAEAAWAALADQLQLPITIFRLGGEHTTTTR